MLAPSGLCSLDIDAPDHALPVLGELGIDLRALREVTVVTTRLDFWSIGQAALAEAERLLAEWLPHGKREGQEWVSLNPTRDDFTPGSFKVNLSTGKWSDFATGDKGGDLISLYTYIP